MAILLPLALVEVFLLYFYLGHINEDFKSRHENIALAISSPFIGSIEKKLKTLDSLEDKNGFLEVYTDLKADIDFPIWLSQYEHLTDIAIVNGTGKLLAATSSAQDFTGITFENDDSAVSSARTNSTFAVSVPLRSAEHTFAYLLFRFSDKDVVEEEREALLLVGMIMALSLLFGSVLAWIISSAITKPINLLALDSEKLAAGDIDHEISTLTSTDEIGLLASNFHLMRDSIRGKLKELEEGERSFRRLFENAEISIWDEDLSGVLTALDKLRQEGVSDLRQYLEENIQAAWNVAAMVKVTQVNEATLKLFGAKTQEDILSQIDKTFGSNSIETFIDELCAIWDNQRSFRSETAFRTLDGKDLNAILSFHIPEMPDDFRSVPVSIIDITERKRAEEELAKYRDQLELLVEDRTLKLKEAQSELIQSERLATLGRLTATVSHELRNPLGTIKTALFSIEDSIENKELHQADRPLELAERSIDRCVNIIEELNSYARVKALDLSKTSLGDWLKTVLDEQTIPEGIQCELDLLSGIWVSMDQEKLRQAMVNLMTNAVHALQDERSTGNVLQVSTHLLDSEYEIRVRDDGIGMSDETKEKAFEPLYSTKGFGVGLGMVIVKNIVEQHHGQVSIESKEGKGTTVSLRLPICPPYDKV